MIKLFRFTLSNLNYSGHLKLNPELSVVASLEEIENEVNGFLSDKKLISLHVNHVDVKHHNNGGDNVVDLIYTVVYEK